MFKPLKFVDRSQIAEDSDSPSDQSGLETQIHEWLIETFVGCEILFEPYTIELLPAYRHYAARTYTIDFLIKNYRGYDIAIEVKPPGTSHTRWLKGGNRVQLKMNTFKYEYADMKFNRAGMLFDVVTRQRNRHRGWIVTAHYYKQWYTRGAKDYKELLDDRIDKINQV